MSTPTAPTAIAIRPLVSGADYAACLALQYETWGPDFGQAVPPAILKVTQRLGGVAAGAFDEHGKLLGFVFGLTGVEHGRVVHWSDMLAVRPGLRDAGIGRSLKAWQRAVVREVGAEVIYWTFDPLVARNAHLNFNRLRVRAHEYVRDMYGDSSSELHRGLGTDRLVVAWDIGGEPARPLPAGGAADIASDIPALRDLPAINEVTTTAAGPRSAEPGLDLSAPTVRLLIPSDIQRVKQDAPELAAEWRRTTRAAFESYMARGYDVHGFVRGAECGEYILVRARHSDDPGVVGPRGDRRP